MENYKDPPVSLTIRKFGREEFCLITGLRFGPENSDHNVEGINPFKRLLFGSDIDGGHITGQMLLDKINGEEFSKMQDEDAVVVCQLAVLHLILLGRQPAHNIPEWWFRLIVDKNKWETYPWGSYVWAKLYRQLRYANSSRWDRFYACQALPNRPPAKYTLSGFTWAFKGARPNRKLRPDAFEAKAEWWVCSRDFFDGRIREAPPIPPPINLTSRFDVPKYIDQRFQRAVPKMFTTQASDSCYDVGQTTLASPSHVGGVNPDAMQRGKREIFPSKYQLSPFTCLPETTVAPKKRANNITNTTRNAIVSPFNLGKAGIDLNSQELMYLGSRATDDYISLHNVDHTKVVRYN
ncbi:phospholipase-like protein [Tanacetum coccineum]